MPKFLEQHLKSSTSLTFYLYEKSSIPCIAQSVNRSLCFQQRNCYFPQLIIVFLQLLKLLFHNFSNFRSHMKPFFVFSMVPIQILLNWIKSLL